MPDSVPAVAVAPVVRTAWVRVPVAEAFSVFTDRIGAWWPVPTHGLFGDRSGGVVFRDGKLIELGVDGQEAVWADILVWQPPEKLVLRWFPGSDPDSPASVVEVEFVPDSGGTRVVIEHRGWEAFGEAAMTKRRSYVGPNAWGAVIDHFCEVAELEAVVDGDLAALQAGYDAFYAEAASGNFGPPPQGEWDVDQVIAHVTLSDLMTVAVCQALVHRGSPTFANVVSQDREVLARWIELAGDRAQLIARGRAAATAAVAALGRLSPEQLATDVPCHLEHDSEVVVDEPRPWESLAIGAQTRVHLPAHIGQLRDLRR